MPGHDLPQELVDIILNSLHDEHSTLRTCAIVSPSWVHTSQRILFRSVSLSPSHYKAGSHSALLAKFQSLMRTSPHLSAHVHVIEFDPSRTMEQDVETLVASLRRLQEIRIVDFEEAPMFPFDRVMPFHKMLALPNVTRLKVGPGAWYLGDVLPCLRNGRGLKEITFQDVIFEGYDACATLIQLPHIQLEALSIDRGFVGLLGDLHEIPGLDLTRLKNLSILLGVRNAQTSMRWRNRLPIGAIQDVLSGIEGTLEDLTLDVFLDQPLCKLIDMTMLRSLTIHIRWYVAVGNPALWLEWICESLKGIDKSCALEEVNLRVTTYADDVVPDMTHSWKALDALLSRPFMQSLRRVNVRQDMEGLRTEIPQWCGLERKGVTVSAF